MKGNWRFSVPFAKRANDIGIVDSLLDNKEKLYRAYSPIGRIPASGPCVLFKVMVYGYPCGIYSSRKLEEMGETDPKAVFVDGTKVESRARRYTFVWRKSVGKHLEKVKAQAAAETGLRTLEALREAMTEQAREITFVKELSHRKSGAQKR